MGREPKAPEEAAFDAAARLLAHRARSRAELARRLAQKGFEEAVVAETLTHLEHLGLIDDAAFAAERVRGLLRRGAGPRLVRARLKEAGVPDALVEAALVAALDEAGGEEAVARETLKRRGSGGPPRTEREARRAAAYLVRRGFSPSVAGAVAGVFRDL